MPSSSSRPAIEKWERSELEDRFHTLSEQNFSLKKQNNQLQRELKILNGRKAGRGLGTTQKLASEEDEGRGKRSTLERENRLLEQKVKVLKHQLLSYGRPATAQTTTSTRHGNRPGSISSNVKTSVQREEDILEMESTFSNEGKPRPNKREDRVAQDNITIAKNVADKTALIRLHRQNRALELEVEELKFSISKSEQKLSNIRTEYDRVAKELESARTTLRTMEESMRSMREDALRRNESSHKSVGIAEKELAILSEENRVLRAAHDRLVASSLEVESGTKSSTTPEELHRFNAHVEELQRSLSEQIGVRRGLEAQITALQARSEWLEARYARLKDAKAKGHINSSKKSRQQGQISEEEQQSYSPPPPPPPPVVRINSYTSSSKQGTQKHSSKDPNSFIVDRLFQDVVSIVDAHVSRNGIHPLDGLEEDMDSEGVVVDSKITSRWQKMYEQIYLELEKVRNMLVTQYSINQGMKQEMSDLQASLEFAKQDYTNKLAEFTKQLTDKAKESEILENQLRSVASTGVDLSLGTTLSSSVLREDEQLGATEMTLRLTKLTISEEGLRRANSAKPVLFLSVEFFDFELQTTPLLIGPE